MSDENTPERILKSPEIKRDPEGRFERHGKTISKTQKQRKSARENRAKLADKLSQPGINKSDLIDPIMQAATTIPRRGRGRPKGSLGAQTIALKEQILQALDKVGGPDYLATLAIENSSAFAGLLGKVLPSTLAVAPSDGGKQAGISFERIIVWPDGHREIEGVTPKQLAAPSTVRKTVDEEGDDSGQLPNDINDSA